ncbi:MAG TPA: hypothetical protein VEH84_15130 [Alphaproteobacteria bacterium]|nr:hypothetical protein [Alphaproteobacteria bacterium]
MPRDDISAAGLRNQPLWQAAPRERPAAEAASADGATAAAPAGGKDESFSFWDFLDIVNPLQHIPVIGSIYRHLTGDEIGGPARILGGALFGGPIGMVAGMVNTEMERQTGRDAGATVIAMVTGADETAAAEAGGAEAAGAVQPQVATAAAPAEAPRFPPPERRPAALTLRDPAAETAAEPAALAEAGGNDDALARLAADLRGGGIAPEAAPAIPPAAERPSLAALAAPSALPEAGRRAAPAGPTLSPWQPPPAIQRANRPVHLSGATAPAPDAGAAPLPPENVAAAMARALDKYEAGRRAATGR